METKITNLMIHKWNGKASERNDFDAPHLCLLIPETPNQSMVSHNTTVIIII